MLGKVRKRIYSVDVFGNDKENKNGTFTDFRGIGLMIGIEFSEIRNKKTFQLFKILPAGQKLMKIMPPLILTEGEALEGREIMDDVLLVYF